MIFGWFRRRGVEAQSAVIQNAPLPLLEGLYSDSQRQSWRDRRLRMEHVRDNAKAIHADQAAFYAAKSQTAIAAHTLGMGRIALDRDTAAAKRVITAQFQGTNAAQLAASSQEIEQHLRGLLGGF